MKLKNYKNFIKKNLQQLAGLWIVEGDFFLEGFLFSSFLVELSLSLVLKVERSSSSYSGPNVSVTIWSSSGGGGNWGGGGGGGAGLNMRLFSKNIHTLLGSYNYLFSTLKFWQEKKTL